MFGLFKTKKTVSELAKSAEILPVAENGDYKAFMVRVLDTTKNFSSAIKAEGGQTALGKFIEIIEDRISSRDYKDIFSVADEISWEHGLAPPKRNSNVERILICADHDGYISRWLP